MEYLSWFYKGVMKILQRFHVVLFAVTHETLSQSSITRIVGMTNVADAPVMHDSVVSPASQAYISCGPRRAVRVSSHSKASCTFQSSDQTRPEGRLALMRDTRLFSFIANTASFNLVLAHNQRKVRLIHLPVFSVGTRLVYGITADNGTSYKKLKAWRTFAHIPAVSGFYFYDSGLRTCHVHLWKPHGSLYCHRNIRPS